LPPPDGAASAKVMLYAALWSSAYTGAEGVGDSRGCPSCPFVGTDSRDSVPADPWDQIGTRWATIFEPGTRPEGE
jgi:hypothetical protein